MRRRTIVDARILSVRSRNVRELAVGDMQREAARLIIVGRIVDERSRALPQYPRRKTAERQQIALDLIELIDQDHAVLGREPIPRGIPRRRLPRVAPRVLALRLVEISRLPEHLRVPVGLGLGDEVMDRMQRALIARHRPGVEQAVSLEKVRCVDARQRPRMPASMRRVRLDPLDQCPPPPVRRQRKQQQRNDDGEQRRPQPHPGQRGQRSHSSTPGHSIAGCVGAQEARAASRVEHC